MPAALRQPVGVRAAARSGARRHVGVQAGRGLAATTAGYVRNTNVLRTEIETGDGRFELFDFAPRIMQGLKVDAPIEICRLLRPLAGHAARARAFRSAARLRPRQRRDRRRRDRASRSSAVRRACTCRPTCRRRTCMDGTRDPDRSADVFLAERRQAAGHRFGAGRRDRARADHPRLARLGEDHARCRRSRRSRCCDRRCA